MRDGLSKIIRVKISLTNVAEYLTYNDLSSSLSQHYTKIECNFYSLCLVSSVSNKR